MKWHNLLFVMLTVPAGAAGVSAAHHTRASSGYFSASLANAAAFFVSRDEAMQVARDCQTHPRARSTSLLNRLVFPFIHWFLDGLQNQQPSSNRTLYLS